MNHTCNRTRAPRGGLGHIGRWLPWLITALVLSGILWPSTITASHPAYQSALPYDQSPLPEAFPVEESPLPPLPVELPMPADMPPEEVPPAELPAPLPTPEELPPAEAFPQEVVPSEPIPPPAQIPGEIPQAPVAPATPANPVRTRPAPSGLLIDEPIVQPPQTPEDVPVPRISQFVINWTKFWDTIVLYASYPWLCCGILLLLGVPLAFLMLEIRGRRRPRVLPEPPTRKPQPPDAAPKP